MQTESDKAPSLITLEDGHKLCLLGLIANEFNRYEDKDKKSESADELRQIYHEIYQALP